MRINEFVEPKRKAVIIEAEVKPRLKVMPNGQIEATLKQNGKVTKVIYENAKVAEMELKKLKPGLLKRMGDAVGKKFSKAPAVKATSKFLGGQMIKWGMGVGAAYADVVWTSYAVMTGKMNPREAATTGVSFIAAKYGAVRVAAGGIKLAAVGAVKSLSAIVKATKAYNVIKWIKRILKIGTATTAAAGVATGGFSWIGTIGIGVSWIATEILAYIGVRVVVGWILDYLNPEFEMAQKSAQDIEMEMIELQLAIQEAKNLQNENPNLGTNKGQPQDLDSQPAFGESLESALMAGYEVIRLAEQKGLAELEELRNERFLFEEEMPDKPADANPSWTGFVKHIEKNRGAEDAGTVIDNTKISKSQKKVARKLYVDKDVKGATELLQKLADKKS